MKNNNNILKKLDPYKGNNSFKVPDGYFDNLSNKILDKINEEPVKKKNFFIRKAAPWMSIAAILVIGLFIIKWVSLNKADTAATALYFNNIEEYASPLLADMTDIELMDYIAENEYITIIDEEYDLTLGLTPEDLESLVLF